LDLLTPLGTTSNYSATANLHNLQFTTAAAKPFPACCVLTIGSLATASNSGDSSASRVQVQSSQPPVQNSGQFPQSQLTIINYQLRKFQTNSLLQLPTISLPSLPNLPCRAQLSTANPQLSLHNSQLTCGPRYIATGQTQQNTPFLTIPLLLLAYSFRRERVYRAVA
jgi:hypothetical protein